MSAKGVLLDTSVVIRHLRDRNAIVAKLLEYEEICLPYVALAELYAGAYRSSRPEWHLDQISRFQEAVDLILPDDATTEIYGRISAQLVQAGPRSLKTTSGLPPSPCKQGCRWPPRTGTLSWSLGCPS
jgi:tRNA(fMet)-specific endonuclease VapC